MKNEKLGVRIYAAGCATLILGLIIAEFITNGNKAIMCPLWCKAIFVIGFLLYWIGAGMMLSVVKRKENEYFNSYFNKV